MGTRKTLSSPKPPATKSNKAPAAPAPAPAPKEGGSERAMRRDFDRARDVHLGGITGRERPDELLTRFFPAFVGRQERRAFELMSKAVDEDYAVFMTFSGAMTPAGMHQSCFIPLLERGLVDCVTTTGANLYHDAHRVIGHRIREIDPNAGDLALRLARIIRIYDLGFWEETLLETDRLFSAILMLPEFQRTMTTPELHYLLGKYVYQVEQALGVKAPSFLSTCYRLGVPIFVGAVQDGSIFLNIVKLRRLFPETFKLQLDVAADVYEMGAIQNYCLRGLKKKLGIWIMGGGVPKNYTLQGEPLLEQILFVPTDGFDIDVQICVDPVDNGALSSCPASEGHTWGKVSPEGVGRSVYVHTDVTAILPWLTAALLADPKRKRAPRRLFEQREAALTLLDRAVARKRQELLATVHDPVVDRAVAGTEKKAARKKPRAAAKS